MLKTMLYSIVVSLAVNSSCQADANSVAKLKKLLEKKISQEELDLVMQEIEEAERAGILSEQGKKKNNDTLITSGYITVSVLVFALIIADCINRAFERHHIVSENALDRQFRGQSVEHMRGFFREILQEARLQGQRQYP